MKLLQLNCQSINTARQGVHRYVRDKDIKIVCFSETWHKNETFPFKDWVTHCKNRPPQDNNTYGGVALATHPSIRMVPNKALENSTEVAWATVYINSKIVHLASVYIPPGREDHVELLSEVLETLPPEAPVILTGDFNASSASWDNRRHIPHNTPAYRVGLKVEELIARHGLHIHNTGHYTYVKAHQTTGLVIKTAIDLTLSRNVGSTIQWSVDELACLKSDHLACIANIEPAAHTAPIVRWDLGDVDWTLWGSNLEEALQSWYDQITDTQDDIDAICSTFTDAVIKCAHEHLPQKSVCAHSRPFFTADLKILQDEMRQARRDFKYRSDQHNLARLNQAKDRYNAAYSEASERWWFRTLENIDHRNIWKVVKKIKNSHTHIVVQPIRTQNDVYVFHDCEIAEKLEYTHVTRGDETNPGFDSQWKSYVETQVDNIIVREMARILSPGYIPEQYNVGIKHREIVKSLRHCNSTASPGPDKILPVMLTNTEEVSAKYLFHLFNACWGNGKVPAAWKMDNRVYILKPGKPDYNITKAYRPFKPKQHGRQTV